MSKLLLLVGLLSIIGFVSCRKLEGFGFAVFGIGKGSGFQSCRVYGFRVAGFRDSVFTVVGHKLDGCRAQLVEHVSMFFLLTVYKLFKKFDQCTHDEAA